ncbi:Uncharacterised protein [Halioglobus japonicus]|nr:Uncharacterised protein [Halioglobus japonicus]
MKISTDPATYTKAIARISTMLFVLLFLVTSASGYFVTDCSDGSLGYSNCELLGKDVSVAYTLFTWFTIVGFLAFVASWILHFGVVSVRNLILRGTKNRE